LHTTFGDKERIMAVIRLMQSSPTPVTNDTWSSDDHYDPARAWRKHYRTLEKLAALEPDWDGDDAIPPDFDTIQNAFNIMSGCQSNSFPSPSRVVATTDGSVLIEWQEPSRLLEFEITPSGVLEWMRVEGDASPIHGEQRIPNFGESASDDATISSDQHLQYA